MSDVIVCCLCVVVVIQAIMHRRERRDLYNRIQSRDYKEYVAGTGKPPKAPVSRHEEVLRKWRKQNSKKG